MKNSLTGVALSAAIGALAAITAGAIGLGDLVRVAGVGKKRVAATIFLDQVGGSCMIQTAPQTVELFKKETIDWTIIDRCGVTSAADVQVVFPAANDPLDGSCTRRGKKKITCTVKPAAGFAVYKYQVVASGAVTEDPELEIVQ